MGEQAALLFSQVSKRYHRGVLALQKVSFCAGRGEIFGLLGPNGSGKTTTIKLTLGLLFPTEGEIRVLGSEPGALVNRYRVGYQPEENVFPSHLSAYELLHFYGRLYSMSYRDRCRSIEEVLHRVELSAKDAHRPVGEYSKGMGRRVGLAQALLHDPELLILDEPTSGLDPIGNRKFKELLLELRNKGKTILLSSHLLADMEGVCDRVLILFRGQVVQEGKLEELLASREETEVLLAHSSPTFEKKLGELAQREGVEVRSIRPKRETLEEVFLRALQGNTQGEEKGESA